MIEAFKWYPITDLPDLGAGHREHGYNMVVHAPELVNADCNPHGIAEAYWQDDGLNGDRDPGAFVGAFYCMSCDTWHAVEVTPTHFMYLTAPIGSEAVTSYERQIAEESWLKVNSIEIIPAPPEPILEEPDAPAPDHILDLHQRVATIIRKSYFIHTRNEQKAHETAMEVLEEVTRTYEQLAAAAEQEKH